MVCPWCRKRLVCRLAVMDERPDRIVGQCAACAYWMDDYATATNPAVWRPMRPEEAATYQARVAAGTCRLALTESDY